MTRSRDTADYGSRAGLAQVRPSSVAVGSGSATVADSGLVTFTSSSSVSLNGCFSSTYTNYKVILIASSFSADNSVQMRMRASGADNSTTNSYTYACLGKTFNNIDSNSFGPNNAWIPFDPDSGTNDAYNLEFTFYNAFETKPTTMNYAGTAVINAGTLVAKWGSGHHNQSTSYDGFSFIPSSGTFSGTLVVYGYKK